MVQLQHSGNHRDNSLAMIHNAMIPLRYSRIEILHDEI